MEFERRTVTMDILDPAAGYRPARLTLEQRWDPLTGQGCRLLPALNLFPPAEVDIGEIAPGSQAHCPFCPDKVESVTPRFPATILPQGRLRRGETVLFPNLHPYAAYSSVAVFSPRRHLLPLAELTPTLVGDNLAAQVEFVQAVTQADQQTRWASVNANHLPPSGRSVLHPHTQGSVHPYPTGLQRLLAALPPERFRDYVAAERAEGRRYLGNTGTVHWLAAFAPAGPAELRAVLFGASSPQHLTEDRVRELADGIATALTFYAELGFASYNLALYGTPEQGAGAQPADRAMLLRMLCRSNPRPWYRSDVMWLERLHGDAAVDLWPEDIAEQAGGRFRG
jgi:UDPglucose--hexose-1-phosphate uridylyltransferase